MMTHNHVPLFPHTLSSPLHAPASSPFLILLQTTRVLVQVAETCDTAPPPRTSSSTCHPWSLQSTPPFSSSTTLLPLFIHSPVVVRHSVTCRIAKELRPVLLHSLQSIVVRSTPLALPAISTSLLGPSTSRHGEWSGGYRQAFGSVRELSLLRPKNVTPDVCERLTTSLTHIGSHPSGETTQIPR